MPRTSLTVTSLAQYSVGLADIAAESADQSNGNDAANDGSTYLDVINGSGGNVTCTITAVAGVANYNEAFTKALTVAAGNTGRMGPFPTRHFGDTLLIDWDTDTSITVAAVSHQDAERTPR